MKNKFMFILLASLLFAILFLSACGTSNDDANQSEQDNIDEEVETDEPAEEEVEEDTSDENEANEDETSDGNEEDDQAEEATDDQDGTESEPQVVLENEAFRIFEPAENTVVENEFTVRGEARVFEANVLYEFEDGHNILDEGFVTASAGAPEWGEFEFTINFDDVFFETGTVILYEEDAKDGSRKNQLYIPVKVEK